MQSLAARAARPALVKPRPSKPSRRVSVLTPRASAPGGSGDEIEILEQAFAKAPVTKKLSTPALLACPICLTPFPAGSLRCARCARDAYPTKDGILDLCLDANGAASRIGPECAKDTKASSRAPSTVVMKIPIFCHLLLAATSGK